MKKNESMSLITSDCLTALKDYDGLFKYLATLSKELVDD